MDAIITGGIIATIVTITITITVTIVITANGREPPITAQEIEQARDAGLFYAANPI
jgi:hypothetical protein